MTSILPISQVLLSVLLIALVLLQPRGSGLGSAFGGDTMVFAQKRGIQQKIHWLTIFSGFSFIGLALLSLVV
ncbi:MAG: preprotein translocase subunit SecG [Candidatus Wildermuthbacteria bacterium RIFCSPHIGHO2_01_FULL_48_25]|uniref:Protein-export membrane protein SecG n=1 Tax=Candidatus Wildermuthbacteria bacterium RIFCSPLOWO2_01_FULL_48_16 TaxID=1802461 RepID=A0A1G2RKI9_9BACT|nr:MAG: preprotein translocase subunit SecG [Candidatus Wildermuthbacteria bacterium RIFCSPHIGHO2_01_FULL_48_25]OHA68719.1 MAG: preprotein translocase subunit SecG [Candidatus Wildermuthbacteria bacterium RIFCSPHIGHO2_02_FULL_49_12b]OHA73360.1 MAG: preprotein translocase subunit SecG [Candidatus Wildermuthbacteria bacterium RIFCSPLOWO2_01_FULL_48_16]